MSGQTNQPMTFPTGGYNGQTNQGQTPTNGTFGNPGFPNQPLGNPNVGMGGQDLNALLQQWLQQRMQGSPSNSPYTSFLNNSPYTKF
jgi:hypothetical protein